MESCTIAVTSHDYADARRILSECWIFTPERGLRAMTLHGNGSTLAIDGQRLIRWCILEESAPPRIIAYLYSAESPSPELHERVVGLARERFPARADARLPVRREEAQLPVE
jgi:hypothetical protein